MTLSVPREVVKALASALDRVRTLRMWANDLTAPGEKPSKAKPLVRLPREALAPLRNAEEELRDALVLAGENPGWSVVHADAIVTKVLGYSNTEKLQAPPDRASAEAEAKVAELEAEVDRLRAVLAAEKTRRVPVLPSTVEERAVLRTGHVRRHGTAPLRAR